MVLFDWRTFGLDAPLGSSSFLSDNLGKPSFYNGTKYGSGTEGYCVDFFSVGQLSLWTLDPYILLIKSFRDRPDRYRAISAAWDGIDGTDYGL